jgi:hypothetical protein
MLNFNTFPLNFHPNLDYVPYRDGNAGEPSKDPV